MKYSVEFSGLNSTTDPFSDQPSDPDSHQASDPVSNQTSDAVSRPSSGQEVGPDSDPVQDKNPESRGIPVQSAGPVCAQCGKKLHGRSDKRFCDMYCRNAFNNKVRRKSEQQILALNRQLRKNRTIMKTLSPRGKATVRREVMASLGYDFGVFSSMYKSPTGLIYYLCYEYGFSPIFDLRGIAKAVIINRQKFMHPWDPWKYVKNEPK